MKSAITLCALAAFFVLGYFLMKRLDTFLESNKQAGENPQKALRIAFENPALAGGAEDIIREFSKAEPDCEIIIYSVRSEDIPKKLEFGKLDIAFADEASLDGCGDAGIPVLLTAGKLTTAGGISIQPGDTAKVSARAVSSQNSNNPYIGAFTRILSRYLKKRQRKMRARSRNISRNML